MYVNDINVELNLSVRLFADDCAGSLHARRTVMVSTVNSPGLTTYQRPKPRQPGVLRSIVQILSLTILLIVLRMLPVSMN